jgi:hypothetical protein
MNDYSSFLGVRQRMALGYSPDLFMYDSRNTNQDYSFSTSMRLPSPVEITFSPISLGWQRNYRVLPSEAVIDTTTVFPDFKAEAQTNVFEKIPAVKKTLTRLGVRTGYGFKKSVHKTYNNYADRSIRQDVTRGHSWAPLINIDGVLKKWPINLSYTWSFSRDSTVTLIGDTVSQHSGILKKNHTHVWTAKYTIPGKADRQINLLKRWTVPIKGDLTIGLTMNYGSNSIFKENLYFNLKNANKPDKDAYDEALMRSTDFSIAPELTYDFTDNINGLVTYLYQQTFDGQTKVKNTKNEFVLTVKIYFK